jgi:galactokinase
MPHTQQLLAAFQAHFNGKPDFVVRAPGRVNLIGEHTDYNDGFVLPMAIDRAVWIALRRRADGRIRLRSLDLDEQAEFELQGLERAAGWSEDVKGMAWALAEQGWQLRGWEGVMSGDVPIGSGLSSSAAVELAAARAFAATSNLDWDAPRMARLAQLAENRWVGVNCGIMDQMACAAARAGRALFLDCRTLAIRHVALPESASVVVLDTSTRRGLVDSAYNERRAQCEAAARFYDVQALRDVDLPQFESRRLDLQEPVMRRARHIVSENARVLRAVEAMNSGEVAELGRLLSASHASLRDDFEVSSRALDQIVEAAESLSGCYGARMTGAGFGGCAVALVQRPLVEAFVPAVAAAYRKKSGLEAAVYVCEPSEGASIEWAA